MRRQSRRAFAIGPVAAACVALHVQVQKCLEPLLTLGLARRPALAKPDGPVRMPGLKAPTFKRVAADLRRGHELLWCGQRLRRRAHLHSPPEWGEHPKSPAVLVTDACGSC